MTNIFSPKGIAFLKFIEGAKNRLYNDSRGLPTIGVGHLITTTDQRSGVIKIGDESVSWRGFISDAQVDTLLLQDAKRFIDQVNRSITVPLNQQQFNALVIFCFNIGVIGFAHSTLVSKLNTGDYAAVPGELMKWTKQPELKRRREREATLFNDGHYDYGK